MRLALTFLALLLAVPASAQRSRPWAQKGDVALVVGVSGLTDLTPALGGIGLRYRATDRTVIGTSIGFDYVIVDADDRSGVDTRRGLQLALWNENHLGNGRGIVSPFVGAGATFGVSDVEQEVDFFPCNDFGCPDTPQNATFSATNLSFGVGALLGAEARVAPGITFGAAYTLGVVVDRTTQSTPFDQGSPGDRTVVRVGTGVTNLNLSVYF